VTDDDLHLDAQSLRVLAHPLRSRLLTELRLRGPATATGLAASLETHTGATSYHLRRLADVGLVVDTGEGAGRRRVWAAATRSHSWEPSDFAGDPDAEASLAWLTAFYASHHRELVDAWARHSAQWPGPWRDALGSGDDRVRVTPEQAAALRDELLEVVDRHRDAGAGDPRAVDVMVYLDLVPTDAEPPVEER
jgi:predicted ArsR family transcriptional regulator